MEKHVVVCVGREYGSGGREIGKLLAEKLNYNYYDKELIAMAAAHCGLNQELLERMDEKPTNPFLYSLSYGMPMYGMDSPADLPFSDQLYLAQSEIINELSKKENCVIVGRCANAILQNYDHMMSFFIYSDTEARVARIIKRHPEYNAAQAEKVMIKTDKRRREYYNYYADNKWGEIKTYDMSVNSALLGVEGTEQILQQYIACRLQMLNNV